MVKNILFKLNDSPGEEIKSAFSRTEHPRFSRGSSLKGRAVCLVLIPVQAAQIGLKPLIYTAFTITNLFYGIFCASDKKLAFVTSGKFAATAIVSPFGQIAKTIQAAAGVIHPGAYFKKPPPIDDRDDIGENDISENDISENDIGENDIDENDIGENDIDENDIDENDIEDPFDSYCYSRSQEGNPNAISYNALRYRTYDFLNFRTSHDAIKNNPGEVIHSLANDIKQNRFRGRTCIFFEGEQGSDAGGLSKAFFYELFQSLSGKYDMQEKLIPFEEKEVQGNGSVKVNGSNEALLEDIGTVLAFLLIDVSMDFAEGSRYIKTSPYTIGDAIVPSYFKGMLVFSYEELRTPFEELSTEVLFAVYTHTLALRLREDGSEENNKTTLEIVKGMSEILNLPDNCDDIIFKEKINPLLEKIDEIYYTELQNDWSNANIGDKDKIIGDILKELLGENGIEEIKGLHAIAKGMNLNKEVWKNLQAFGHKHVQYHIAGRFSKEGFKKAIIYTGLSPLFQQQFEEWIDSASTKDLKAFLSWATGSAAIPHNKLRLEGKPDMAAPLAHTCFNSVDVPQQLDFDHFISCALQGTDNQAFDRL